MVLQPVNIWNYLSMANLLDERLKCGSTFLVSVQQTLTELKSSGGSGKVRKSISFLNPFSYLKLSATSEVAGVIDEFYADGAMLCYCHRLKYGKIKRASFDYSSMAGPFLAQVAYSGARVAIIGATADEIAIAIVRIQQRFPTLNIVLTSHGYIASYAELAEEFDTCKPEVIVVGMGTPFQERFLQQLNNGYEYNYLAITCGGFLTQTSIREDYYWPITKKLGMRWLQRMLSHKHVRDRVIKDYPVFLYKYFGDFKK